MKVSDEASSTSSLGLLPKKIGEACLPLPFFQGKYHGHKVGGCL